MKTVGELKKAGAVFIVGDCATYKGSGNDRIEMNELGIEHMNQGFNGDWLAVEFAWRTNTGERPSFDGLIEAEWSDGDKEMVYADQVANWGVNLEVDSFVTAWRPSLNQGKKVEPKKVSKPTYTKAMADAGELPPVGVRVMIDSNGIKLEGYRVYGGVVCIGSKQCGFTSDNDLGDVIYSPIQTGREKLHRKIHETMTDGTDKFMKFDDLPQYAIDSYDSLINTFGLLK